MLGREIFIIDEWMNNMIFIRMLGKEKIKSSEYCSSFETTCGKVELTYGDVKLTTVASFSTVSPTLSDNITDLEFYLFEKAGLKMPIPLLNVFKVICNNDFEYYFVDDAKRNEIRICIDEYFWHRNRNKYKEV